MSSLVRDITRLVAKKSRRRQVDGLSSKIIITPLSAVKRVNKPWGFEIWLSDASRTPYAFKIIYLKSGTKTSLQFHRRKAEHNYVMSGKIKLHYEDVTRKKIRSVTIEAGSLIEVMPPAVHRVEALADTLLVETSTAHLDDVVRLQDDYQRPDGKIKAEHGEK